MDSNPPAFLAAQAPETPLVQPFALQSASQFRPDAPPELGSRRWARDYNEVKALGSLVGSARTAEQTDIARFWSDNPPLQWIRAWRALSVGQFLRVAENARYFAMLSTASADALIACWDAKYAYNAWRPVTAIRAGESDGNPYTAPDPSWIGLIATPNHPEYPAAHGCFSGAVTETLKSFFGSDEVCALRWTATSPASSLPFEAHADSQTRCRRSGEARIYGGMHYRTSTRIGALLGEQVARYTTKHFFRPAERARRSRTTLIQETRC